MQTVETLIRRRVLRRLIWVYTFLPLSLQWDARLICKDFDQTARMCGLIWVFTGRTCNYVGNAVLKCMKARPSHRPLNGRRQTTGVFKHILNAQFQITIWFYTLTLCYFLIILQYLRSLKCTANALIWLRGYFTLLFTSIFIKAVCHFNLKIGIYI